MTKRKLSSYNFDKDLKTYLQKANFKTVEDILSESFLQLMAKLHLSSDETRNLVLQLSASCLPPCYQGYELMSNDTENPIAFGDEKLDYILRGGVQRGTITEFTGPPSVGKTQMCFHLALQCMQMKCFRSGVCYIDTEGALRPERLYEMIEHCSELKSCYNLLSRFHVFQPKTVSALQEILSKLELFCIENDVGLIIVDSVASLARKEFSQDTKFHRSSALSSWSAQFKTLAYNLHLSVVLTNQVASRNTKDTSSDEDEEKNTANKETSFVVPALGRTWAHFVNTRFILQFLSSNERQLIVAKSPVAPNAIINYFITNKGINFEGEISYTFDGINPSKYRIKVQPAY